ncbi:kinase [Streptomyces sp. NPDC001381]|uniref:GHMP family kinase ATP-binding protein n=1 Tax=Streptomyces sp. NPDC001381 TaxID=3364567 RepID=UPI003693BD0D
MTVASTAVASTSVRTVARVGRGTAPAHHGELLQGAFTVPDRDTPVRALVTLPCPSYTTRAAFTPAPGGAVTVSPPWKTKARRAAELALGDRPAGGRLELSGEVPLGRGFGSSTSDVLAAVRAVRDAYDAPLTAREAARLAVRAETAADALMFEETTVLFAQREGRALEDFGRRLPPLRVLGFGTRPGGDGRGVDTLSLPPPRYDDTEIARFDHLRELLRCAVRTGDAALLGTVATRSALLNQRHLPVPALDRLLAVAHDCAALGVQVAHSGDIAGLLFTPAVPPPPEARRRLRHWGFEEQWEFTTGRP